MAPEDGWSDSDDEVLSDTETGVHLGVPGETTDPSDILDAAVSRIGGHPAFITSHEPSFDSSLCKNCQNSMELLVQFWCALPDSPYDRVLYVWGCSRGICQGKDGSVRAWRALRYNARYAVKLEKKRARQKTKKEAEAKAARDEEERRKAAKANPFSMSSSGAPFGIGLGDQILGNDSQPVEEQHQPLPTHDEKSETDDETGTDEDELITAMATVTLDTSKWASAPAYSSLYLETFGEYIPKAKPTKVPSIEDTAEARDMSWAMEGYENSLETDHVFDRFSRRVEYEPDQCLRYEMGGMPLPFAHDAVFDRLFPVPRPAAVTVTKAAFMATPTASKRVFDRSSLPACPHCGAARVFEFQLMPNLINALKRPSDDATKRGKDLTDEERRKEVERALKRTGDAEGGLMDWGTCMIFSCEKDCEASKTYWAEEVVLIQWDL